MVKKKTDGTGSIFARGGGNGEYGGRVAQIEPRALSAAPMDKNPEWVEIYGKLRNSIGEWPAFRWFDECRFIGRNGGVITLANQPFRADMALRDYGYQLCEAAICYRAVILRRGGILEGEAVFEKVPVRADKPFQVRLKDMPYPRKNAIPESPEDAPKNYTRAISEADMNAARLSNPMMRAAMKVDTAP